MKPLNNELAFNKGIEYASEIFFVYGTIIGVTLYELKRQ